VPSFVVFIAHRKPFVSGFASAAGKWPGGPTVCPEYL
jgi:hypothetical protein